MPMFIIVGALLRLYILLPEHVPDSDERRDRTLDRQFILWNEEA
jgi:hypothetical protein